MVGRWRKGGRRRRFGKRVDGSDDGRPSTAGRKVLLQEPLQRKEERLPRRPERSEKLLRLQRTSAVACFEGDRDESGTHLGSLSVPFGCSTLDARSLQLHLHLRGPRPAPPRPGEELLLSQVDQVLVVLLLNGLRRRKGGGNGRGEERGRCGGEGGRVREGQGRGWRVVPGALEGRHAPHSLTLGRWRGCWSAAGGGPSFHIPLLILIRPVTKSAPLAHSRSTRGTGEFKLLFNFSRYSTLYRKNSTAEDERKTRTRERTIRGTTTGEGIVE